MNKLIESYDVVVVGAGMTGAAAALGFAQEGMRVALLEKAQPAAFAPQSAPDVRISAISRASVELLEQLGAWQHVKAMRSAPYRQLETWEEPESNVVFDAQSLGLPELGFMVENRVLQLALWQECEKYSNLDLVCPARLINLYQPKSQEEWILALDDGRALQAKLVIGADGANSQVRKMAGIGSRGWQYRQSCMLISIQTQQSQQDKTWQQFFPSGPRAFLPLYDNWASLVWYDSPAKIRRLQGMSMEQLTGAISEAFPERLGPVTAIASGAFPLTRHHARRYVIDGLALIGDAAHTINPLAGQGVNLGYRDVDALLKEVIYAREYIQPWHSLDVLKRYQRRRLPDNLIMQAGMDVFYMAFSEKLPGLKIVRNLGLMAAQRAGEAKKLALKYALGL
ncbi:MULTISPECIES: 3-demethoxyubiquinol 3-hydroxylase [Providencia]|uniref:3-demethoxyubiquinol 3-hydroxylase n=1 Tax=Providencia TaxID=586 RepID=UPI001ADACC79|nr:MULTISPECIES: 3-demethoxyubiquinol 3-hydroxylase [Providencia]EMC8779491.1 2-octaprenyl-3-methyl-6-methoxy-1,4-benzoquinol hydroxylase [Providencia rettgeri]MBO8252736.1 2-octaprenyl-3-methyl-6-methoxy-1,4-benzoquinol hydroxylase [Providencia rettgeri]MBO8256580.1 2-octaprenyl-3-methyl-6-methoxy-1,4-benzoquinol hydroxylase [Providencia rettgeri]MBQ0340905.1 2-octaprenyl-3-methyl-6-methoxy-1,4-benzoquinol hydroxylase [Providencia rettgeri]MBQ0398847.1 2-octaprenyl-3-methyl-6-methoxy-1,4-benz